MLRTSILIQRWNRLRSKTSKVTKILAIPGLLDDLEEVKTRGCITPGQATTRRDEINQLISQLDEAIMTKQGEVEIYTEILQGLYDNNHIGNPFWVETLAKKNAAIAEIGDLEAQKFELSRELSELQEGIFANCG